MQWFIVQDCRKRDNASLWYTYDDWNQRDTLYVTKICITKGNKLSIKYKIYIFVLLFAGETSSGKSTLINRIIGKKIFKGRNLESTSTVCKIRNSESVRIIVEDVSGKKEVIHLAECDVNTEGGLRKLRGTLKDLTDMTLSKESTQYQSVDIGFPIPFLKVINLSCKALWYEVNIVRFFIYNVPPLWGWDTINAVWHGTYKKWFQKTHLENYLVKKKQSANNIKSYGKVFFGWNKRKNDCEKVQTYNNDIIKWHEMFFVRFLENWLFCGTDEGMCSLWLLIINHLNFI